MEAQFEKRPQPPTQPRPYRSKRHRPCDVCRRRKHACFFENDGPCRVCRVLGTECTFNDPPSKRQRREQPVASQPPAPVVPPSTHASQQSNEADDTGPDDGEDDEDLAPRSIEVELTAVDDSNASWSMTDEVATVAADARLETLIPPDFSTSPLMFEQPFNESWYCTAAMFDINLNDFVTDVGQVNDGFIRVPTRLPSPAPTQEIAEQRSSQPVQLERSSGLPLNAGLLKQTHSLDKGHGNTQPEFGQYLGLSGELDPYLMQQMQFAEDGHYNLGRLNHLRVMPVSGSQTEPPIQFINPLPKLAPDQDESFEKAASELNKIVPPDLGPRLIALFLRYAFPSLPILSRTRLKVLGMTLFPNIKILRATPPYLLAAIYAFAHSFRHYDPVLNVFQDGSDFCTSKLWQIAKDGISQNMEASSFTVLQTMLLYLHRPGDNKSTAITNDPTRWPMLNSAIHLANRLGLQRDCATWPIPDEEKRLRRRLWWALYSEATWHSLLLGLPHPIHPDEWDVSPLGEEDFIIDQVQCPAEETWSLAPALQKPCRFCHKGHDFGFLAELAVIAHEVHRSFYTLKAAKTLAADPASMVSKGNRLLARLKEWRRNIPAQMNLDRASEPDTREYFHTGSSANLNLASLTLEALIYRTLIRSPKLGLACSESSGNTSNCGTSGYTDVFRGAADLARRTCQYAARLGSYDRSSFLFYWSPACFALISNFIMFLLVVAPNGAAAKEALNNLARWVITLRAQCASFDNMRLGLLRIDAVFSQGLENTFRLSPHVKESIRNERPARKYQD